MPNQLAHVGLTVASIERTAAFYAEHLGFDPPRTTYPYETPWIGTMVGHPGTRITLAFMALGDLVVELHEYAHPVGHAAVPADTTFVGCAHLAIAVDDIDAEYTRMRDAGVDFLSAPSAVTEGRFEGVLGCYFRDPDGYVIELNQAAPSVPAPEIGELTTRGGA